MLSSTKTKKTKKTNKKRFRGSPPRSRATLNNDSSELPTGGNSKRSKSSVPPSETNSSSLARRLDVCHNLDEVEDAIRRGHYFVLSNDVYWLPIPGRS